MHSLFFQIKYAITRHWAWWSDKPLLMGVTINELLLVLSMKILFVAVLVFLLILVGNSTMWKILQGCINKANCILSPPSSKKFTLKSPHNINSILGLYNDLHTMSKVFKKWSQFPLGDLCIHNTIILFFVVILIINN